MKLTRLQAITALNLTFILTSVACHQPSTQALTSPPRWSQELQRQISALDAQTDGNLGVYVRKIDSGEDMSYQTDRDWYFASTVKVPVAIAVLQLVEERKLSLKDKIILSKNDLVDGSGEVQFKRPGVALSISYLLEKMLTQSDSTATDMLIRKIGEENLNSRIKNQMGIAGFNHLTTILQVRKDAYSNLHPNADRLTNRDFIDLKRYKSTKERYRVLAKKMRVPVNSLREKSIEAAFETYYKTKLNSGSLKSYAQLLEKLAQGRLLNTAHTDLVLKHMTAMTTGETRIKAGLGKKLRFAQKTGTQVERICNMGIIYAKERMIVTACLEKFGNFKQAEQTLKRVGESLSSVVNDTRLSSSDFQ